MGEMRDPELTHRDAPEDADDQTRREGPGMRRIPSVATRDVDSSAPTEGSPDRLERGTPIGRYLVLGVLGEGGMGVVYSAYDPELDRKVAIKLLQAVPEGARGSDSGSTDQQWLMREAQAMARLQHPNVIAVHDVGQLPGHRVFVAMEQVDGVTLRIWLRDKVRPWREVIEVMLAAGRGLAAAHTSGLVHRDFKPDNVLVGNDGRVRVMDFGLARLRPGDLEVPDQSAASVEARSPLSAPLTEAGTVIGTPAYMAPEIGDGVLADARSDQFSFGCALYEAMYRTRPFARDAPRTHPKQPPDSKVPERIQRVVMRAIAVDPRARFASIDELLAELTRASAPRRTWIAGVAVLGLGAAVAVGFVASKNTAADPEWQMYTGAQRRVVGAWDPAARAAVAKAFAASSGRSRRRRSTGSRRRSMPTRRSGPTRRPRRVRRRACVASRPRRCCRCARRVSINASTSSRPWSPCSAPPTTSWSRLATSSRSAWPRLIAARTSSRCAHRGCRRRSLARRSRSCGSYSRVARPS